MMLPNDLTGFIAKLSANQQVRFILVGILNTAFGYAFFSSLFLLGISYPLALILTTIAGIIFNFNTTGHMVFSTRSRKHFVKFVTAYIGIYMVNISLLKCLLLLGAGVIVGQGLAIPCVVVFSFVLFKYWVFK